MALVGNALLRQLCYHSLSLEVRLIRMTASKLENSAVKDPQSMAQYVIGGKLNLSGLELTNKDIPAIITFLRQNPEVKEIDLSFNHIGDLGLSDFAERNMTVVQANFLGNVITDNGVALFALKNQSVLQANFALNLISDEGVYKFAELNHICLMSKFSTIRYH